MSKRPGPLEMVGEKGLQKFKELEKSRARRSDLFNKGLTGQRGGTYKEEKGSDDVTELLGKKSQ